MEQVVIHGFLVQLSAVLQLLGQLGKAGRCVFLGDVAGNRPHHQVAAEVLQGKAQALHGLLVFEQHRNLLLAHAGMQRIQQDLAHDLMALCL